ncbi:MAG TPA: DUF2844 domain-containing protein [Steroidobacteraceae bacterium]|nr:DUF2844 domain-containing protein [Steroidobacteraceae bacterium]
MKLLTLKGRTLGLALGAALLTGSVTVPVYAALGGDATSVDADVQKMKGQARAQAVSGYTVNEITLPSGTTVREYVSSEGKVFAVTWKGPVVPDMQQMLGTYFEEAKAAAAAPHGGHNHLNVDHPDLVLRSGGHMRAWAGKAYVPSLLPPNFNLGDIQ